MAIESVKFLNTYVNTASLSVGFNGNNSVCQVELIEDPENGLTIVEPEMGTACLLSAGETFKFGGIFQRKNYQESTSGRTWDVVLESPAKVLDGVAVILDGFNGTGYTPGTSTNIGFTSGDFTTQINNVWNPFAVKENYDYSGIFGGSNVNSFGYPASSLLTTLEEISRGEHEFGGKISYAETQYTIDLTEIKKIVPEFYRVRGPVQTLGSIIRDICEVAVVDYYVYMDGTPNEYGIIEGDAEIKFKIVDKTDQPDPDAVAQKIEDLKLAGNWIESSTGKEMSDNTTQKVAVGGPATRYWRAKYFAGHILPVWGKLRDGQYLLSPPVDSTNLDSLEVPIILDNGQQYNATPLEIMAAMSSREAWEAYKIMKGESDIPSKSAFNRDLIQSLESNETTALDFYNTSRSRYELDAQYLGAQGSEREIQQLFNAVSQVGNDFWGRKYFVLLPVEPGGISNNYKFVEEDKDYISSWEIAQSAWVEDKPIPDISFYDSEGKLKPTVTYPILDSTVVDYSAFGSDYSVGFGGITTINGVSIDDDIIWRQDINGNTTAMVLVDVPQVNYYSEETRENDGIFQLAKIIYGIDPDSEGAYFVKANGYESLKFSLPPLPIPPLEIGIPQVSTRYSYGPWYNFTDLNGKAEIINDTNLRPEVFGSTAEMNRAAESLAYVGNTQMAPLENGVIRVTDFPQYNIGDRFTSAGPYITGMRLNFAVGGFTTEYTFNTYTPQRGKLEKYNFDRIANINKNTIRLLQELRDLYQLPVPQRPLPRRPITRKIPPTRYNGFSVFMQVYNPFTNEVSSEIKDPPSAATGAGNNTKNTFLSSPNNNTSPFQVRKSPSDDGDGMKSQPVKRSNDDDTGLFDNGQAFPTARELDPFFKHEETDRGVGIADEDFQDINLKKQKPKSKVNTVVNRLPSMAAGWGFDINGLPVPGEVDEDGNPTGEFAENAGKDRTKWKGGPIDFYWHDKRQVWTAGNRMVEGVLTASIGAPSTPYEPDKTGRMKIIRGEDWVFDAESVNGTAEEIVITNRDPSLSVDIDDAETDVYCICVEINYEWKPVYVGCV